MRKKEKKEEIVRKGESNEEAEREKGRIVGKGESNE